MHVPPNCLHMRAHGRQARALLGCHTAGDSMAHLADPDIAAVLRSDINWDSYASARLITDKDLQLLRRYDKRSPELRASMLDEVCSCTTAS